MKIVYCIHAVSNSGGMERTLQQNANYLADILGYEIVIITTEQKGKKPSGMPPASWHWLTGSARAAALTYSVPAAAGGTALTGNTIWKKPGKAEIIISQSAF